MPYRLIRPLLFRLDAERAHSLTIAGLKMVPVPGPAPTDPMLATQVAGVAFPNPVGLAAGFDKDGAVAHKMHALGFGFSELGTLTPRPQTGNPKPRLFRLAEDQAVINRMGFNNGGQAAAIARLAHVDRKGRVVGVNIGANKDSTSGGTAIDDYVAGVRAMATYAAFLTINISSPNTPGLRALQDKGALDALLEAVMAAQGESAKMGRSRVPIFLKVAPDLAPADIDAIAASCLTHRIDALIVSNTTLSRPALRSAHASETGGLSGAPLRDLALQRLKDFRSAVGPALPLIGVGGITSAEDAYARICAGAALVQLYSALVYQGPFLPRHISKGLKHLLVRDGFTSIAQAVGCRASA
ncbi:quinone-dependent dihydroorotate dehydrogenase [soil metagenome]